MHCRYPDSTDEHSEYTYRLYAISRDGTADQIGSWAAGPGSDVTMPGMTHLASSDIARFELRRNDGTTLLVYTVT